MIRRFLPVFLLFLCFTATAKPRKKKFIFPANNPDKTMIYVPALAFNKHASYIGNDKAIHEGRTETISVKGFYMSPYEVTNNEYLLFMHSQRVKWKAENSKYEDSLCKTILPDTLVWRSKLAYGEPYVEWYFRHPAYSEYPIVGVSYEQCIKFCEWLTEEYNINPDRKFKKVKFRLPTENEWYAAANYNPEPVKKHIPSVIELTTNTKPFPWIGVRMINSESKYLANFSVIDEHSVFIYPDTIMKGYDTIIQKRCMVDTDAVNYSMSGYSLNSGADVTAPVHSYWPTGLGFFNLAGNVEEFIAEYGITKGGSWKDTGYYLRNDVKQEYNSKNEISNERGFRFVMEVIEE